jgi:mono/diheme cytochrome c family protein
MPSYATQIMPNDRWAVIRYLRVLQRAEKPTPEDVEELKKALKEGKVL